MEKEKWVLCPICNNKTRTKIRPDRGASAPRQKLPPDRPGAGRGQERRSPFRQKRQGGHEKIFEKISLRVSPFARFLSLVYER